VGSCINDFGLWILRDVKSQLTTHSLNENALYYWGRCGSFVHARQKSPSV